MRSVLHVALVSPGGYRPEGIMNAFLSNGFSSYTLFDFQLHIYNNDKETMRRMLIQEAERVKPDLIFAQIQSSEVLDIETWQALSKIAFVANFTFDIRVKEKTEWLYNLCPIIDLVCFSNMRDVEECRSRGYNNIICLQSSCDMEVYKPGELSVKFGIVFIGNNFENTNHQFPLSKERREMVELLQREYPNDFKVYGNNWGNSKITTQKEEVEIYRSALIAICQNNFEEDSYTSDRIWRILATGTLCLTKYFPGIEKIFERNVHLDWWHSLDDLKYKIDFYMQVNASGSVRQMMKKGREHVLGNHSWSNRISEMMQEVKKLRSDNKSENCTKMGAHVIDGVIPGTFDEQFNGRTCDCQKLRWIWSECGCEQKQYQLRAEQNI